MKQQSQSSGFFHLRGWQTAPRAAMGFFVYFVPSPGGKSLLKTAFFLLFTCSLVACYEPQEGCQDIAATNFDASADKDCDCCTYPDLQIGVSQHYDTQLYIENNVYVASDGHPFILKNVSFYLSDFQLFQNGTEYVVSDTAGLYTFSQVGNDTLREIFTDDFILVRRVPLINVAGSFRNDGIFDKIQFRLGLDDNAQRVIPSRAPAGHPLRTQADSLWHGRTEGFVFLQVVVARDTFAGTVPDTISLKKADLNNAVFSATGTFKHETGYDFNIILDVDHKKLLEGIDWTTGDISAWKSQIVSNLQGALSVTQ
ncbi:MAG TPA: hypothetical protein PLO67_00550 [Saprospiraceae bacterium]|nr:hypothetical protein [Saprospiraceae bacterium]HPI05401.1 hypothetical protein [Saprospiraceae bacterium]